MIISNGGIATSQILIIEFETLTNVDSSMTNKIVLYGKDGDYIGFLRIAENYNPKPIRRIEIPKPNGKTRPLGILTIWDRILQQSILQVLEPICEAKFYDRSNGFRPNRSVEEYIIIINMQLK